MDQSDVSEFKISGTDTAGTICTKFLTQLLSLSVDITPIQAGLQKYLGKVQAEAKKELLTS